MSEFYNNHYIDVDDKGRILDGWSDGPHRDRDTTNTICINEHGGYQFRIFPGAEENPSLRTTDGIPLYKWEREQVIARTEEEIAEDRAAISPPPPSEQEQLRADVDFLAAMQGDSSVSVLSLQKTSIDTTFISVSNFVYFSLDQSPSQDKRFQTQLVP